MSPALCRLATALVLWGAMAASGDAAPAMPGKRGRTSPPKAALIDPAVALARLKAAKARSVATPSATDTLRLVAMRVEFPDLRFGDSPPADELHDRFYYETQFSNVRQYFRAASNGRLQLEVDVPAGVATAAEPQAFYGDYDHYDSLMVRLAAEAVAFFDPTLDFARYDGFILLHAGPGQESDVAGDSPTQIWSAYLDQVDFRTVLSPPDSLVLGLPTNDGVLVRESIVLPEWEVQDLQGTNGTRTGHLGVYAHEIGQKLGMLPLFDAGPSPIPDSQGVGNFCLMGYGLWVANGFIPALPCAFNRLLMGWVDPIDMDGDATVTLRDYETGAPDSVVALVPLSAREYFLVSYVREDRDGPVQCGGIDYRRFFHFDDKNANCRFDYVDTNGDGVLSAGDSIDTYAGAEWDFFMTDLIGLETAGDGYGLLILHVDEWVLQQVLQGGSSNVQGDPRRKAVDVEEADGIEDLDRFPDNPRAFGSADDYFGRGRAFTPQTTPSTAGTSGAATGLAITLEALPDSTASDLDPNFGLPGGRAVVRVQTNVRAASAPRARAERQLEGRVGADLVALPQADGSAALVVPGAAGAMFLLDAALDDLPAADGDATTLVPWAVAPGLMGPWASAPAVGDLDGDEVPEVIGIAAAEVAGAVVTRVFAWHRDGSGAGTGASSLVTEASGAPRALAVLDLDGLLGDEIAVMTEDSSGVQLWTSLLPGRSPQVQASPHAARLAAGPARLMGGPVGVRWPLTGCTLARGIAWVEADTLSGTSALIHVSTSCSAALPMRAEFDAAPGTRFELVAGDTDGHGADEIVLVDTSGRVRRASATAGSIEVRDIGNLGDRMQSPLALVDLDGDGALEILGAGEAAMHVLSFSGAERQGWPYAYALDPAMSPAPAPNGDAGTALVADVDGDNGMEVLLHGTSGVLLVWDHDGRRRPDLETTAPAGAARSPTLSDLDGDGRPELAAMARFHRVQSWDAAAESLTTHEVTDIGLWSLSQAGETRWGVLGGDGGHSFRAPIGLPLMPRPNDAELASFVVAPNPASTALRARVELSDDATVTCSLHNLEGETVQRMSRIGTTGDIVEFTFDLSQVASGIYFARMELSSGGIRVRPVAIRR